MTTRDAGTEVSLYRYRFDTVELDEAGFEFRVGGLLIELEQKPLRVLCALLARAGEVVTRHELLETVWDGRVTVDNVLNNAIAKLRKAIGDGAGARIVTVHRIGYKFAGSVERSVVGRKALSRLKLRAGDKVPGRESFLLRAQIGSTRSSEVWVACHVATQERRVFKFNTAGDRLASFKREATLNRLLHETLNHPDNIVRVLDWNFRTEPFFLECAYGGDNLAEWAAEGGRLSGLTLSERLDIFLQIADALSAAHGVGVLHKDLKPANVLVEPRDGGSWRVRVADFGSGWLLEPDRLEELGLTQSGFALTDRAAGSDISGTALYMAPEIMAGQVATLRSDIYSLGLIFYQLVVADLRRPMAPGWELAIADELLREDIAAATFGDPALRIGSVAELAQRVRTLNCRHEERALLRDRQARYEAAQRSAARERERRPFIIAAIGSLALGLVISVLLYRDQTQARREAEQERARSEETNRFLSEDLLAAADPSGPGGAHDPKMRDVLSNTAARLDSRFVNNPQTRATIEMALSNAYFGMTDYAAAEKYRRSAVSLLKAERGEADTMTLEAEYPLISVLIQTNRLDEAARMLDRADGLAAGRLAENSQLALKAHWTRAGYYKLRMSPDQALREYRDAERIRAAIDPTDDSLMFRLRDAVSWCYARLNRNDEAERVLRDVITPAYPPERVGPLFWAQARVDYGVALKVLGKNQEAEHILRDSLAELRKSLGDDHFFVAVAQNELGDLYVREARWQDAVGSLKEAHDILRKRRGEHDQATLIVAANLGIVEYRTGQTMHAVELLTSTHEDLTRQLGLTSPQAQSAAYYLAGALCDLRRCSEAAELARPLTLTDLAAAEPREDWAPRLEALRGQILIGLGHQSEGVAKLSAAIGSMKAPNTPAEDAAPFQRILEAASKPGGRSNN